ncbi:hypothetical protein [Streptomyces levis]|uniref:hypothetical protein n=1 Tax=Streptomyces levis TaxID=285566 RepID=UPI003C79D5D3
MENTAHTRAEAAVVYRPEPISGHPLETRPILSPVPTPGAVEARTPDGRTVWVYADLTAPAGTETPAADPAATAVPAWAKTTALLLVSASASLVLAAYAVKVFAEAAAALAAALVLLAKIAFVLAFVVALVAAVVKRGRGRGTQTATATATATAGFLGRAKATATATITNR